MKSIRTTVERLKIYGSDRVLTILDDVRVASPPSTSTPRTEQDNQPRAFNLDALTFSHGMATEG